MSKRVLGCVAVLALAGAAYADVPLWDTGAPNLCYNNQVPPPVLTWLGWSSGNLGGTLPQRWAAVPFRIDGSGMSITEIDIDWFNPTEPTYPPGDVVKYIIWNRTGLNTPVDGDQFSQGTLGPYVAGIDDPRTATIDIWLHQYTGLNIAIPAGDYYLTIYADGAVPPNNAGWLTGAHQPDPALGTQYLLRSATFPNPGFLHYTTAAFGPGDGMSVEDFYTPSFTILGIPEPASLGLLLAGLGLLLRRR